jgi:hypothetical protein
METNFSDYIIYADESGDHQLAKTFDESYPVFVLAFCVFKKLDYAEIALRNLSQLKFDFWGHDAIILHSHKIRKQKEEFSLLNNISAMEKFAERINKLIINTPFNVIATVIDKRRLQKQYAAPQNPYNLGLLFCLERATKFLIEQGQKDRLTYIIVEARGKKEDAELELEFRRIMSQQQKRLASFDIIFSDKKSNGAGLQIADLIAHPIGRHVINPTQENRSYNVVEGKFHKYPFHDGKGLKIFPK